MTRMTSETARLAVRVKPGAATSQVVEFRDNTWQIRVAAPPVEGKANEKLIEFLSGVLKVRKSAISIQRGHTARNKLLTVEGISDAEIKTLMDAALLH
jgi:uncharacterized protein